MIMCALRIRPCNPFTDALHCCLAYSLVSCLCVNYTAVTYSLSFWFNPMFLSLVYNHIFFFYTFFFHVCFYFVFHLQ